MDQRRFVSAWLPGFESTSNRDKRSSAIEISVQIEPNLGSDEFIDVLDGSTLSQRRPVDRPDVIEGMLRHADVIATARTADGKLVGVARYITDFHYCIYLSDLAVDSEYQRQDIGKRLIDLSHETAGSETTLILLSAPAAEEYYPRIGMKPHHSCLIRT